MNHFFLIRQFIKYKLSAKSAHGVHSPFVFDFIKNVLEDDRHFYAFDELEIFRKALYANRTKLQVEDFGAGSLKGNFKERIVSDIAKTAGRNEKFGKLLFRMVNYFNCHHILELGTSLGIGTSYLAKANIEAKVITIEGSKEIAYQAKLNFKEAGILNVEQHVGNFDSLFEPIVSKMPEVDLIFIDGNHRKEPTISYFEQALPYVHEHSILIFDDIHWSEGMQQAWGIIQEHEAVKLSIDLFYFGIVFFRKDFKEKQHFILNY